ncbi:hypothetical protein FGRMN_57 [Fusarium graminum]|nr:hypothetical protein FGRMN_57 [Fusarium graminum]
MLRILTDEDGFDINARELRRVRSRNKWLLRVQNGDRARMGDVEHDDDDVLENDSSSAQGGDMMTPLADQEPGSLSQTATGNVANSLPEDSNSVAAVPKPRKVSKRQSRRNRQHLNEADGIVRFPSEMTLNDSKELLELDQSSYSETRECFARICREESIVKKTLAGPGRWDYVKNRLIHERPNLQQVLWISKENLERKQLALEIICTDVTKRMRNEETKMTLVDAKNELGLNPDESHEIRTALHEVLCDANFTCKSDGTPEQWEELKKQWLEKSARLKAMPLYGDDEQSRRKVRAIEIVARDVIKRKRDEKRSKNARSEETAKQKRIAQRKSQSNVQTSQPAHEDQLPEHHHQVAPARETHPSFSVPETAAAGSRSPASPAVMNNGDLGDAMSNTGFDNVSEPTDSQIAYTASRQYSVSERQTAGSSASASPGGMNAVMDSIGYNGISEPTHSRMTYAATRQSAIAIPTRPVQMQPQATNGALPLPQPHRMLGSSATTGVPMNTSYGSPIYLGNPAQPDYMDQQYVPHQFPSQTPNGMFQSVPAVSASSAVFMRLHPSSTYVTNTSLWISTMASQSIQELRQAAIAKFPGAICVRIEGIIKDPKGNELPLQIQGDDELGAYFAHMQGGSATFAVQLV